MLRYMISPVIGSGTMEDSFRAAVSDVANVNTSAIIPTHTSGPNIGQPKHGFCFAAVATANVGAIAAVSNSFVFPDYVLDGRMDGMETEARTGMVQSLEAYNLDGEGLHFDADHDDADSYRQFITALVQQVEPAFSINALSIAEVSA